MEGIRYTLDLEGVDWVGMKTTLQADDFDNGRSPEQLERSFRNSFAACIATAPRAEAGSELGGGRIIGTARVLSDGVCNAYVVDVWTLSEYRGRGVARRMMELLLERLPGQHVYLFTDDAVDFYKKLGFVEQGVGLSKVVGTWLINE